MNALESLYHGFVEPYVLHLDKQLGAIIAALRHVDVPDPLRRDLLRDRAGGHAVPAGRFAACSPPGRCAGEGISQRLGAVAVVLATAAIVGDNVNYWIGRYIGPRAFSGHVRFLKKEHLDRTHRFFEKYGGKTIILARFVPIVRTFAPFVAGIGTMNYGRFLVTTCRGASPGSASSFWAGTGSAVGLG